MPPTGKAAFLPPGGRPIPATEQSNTPDTEQVQVEPVVHQTILPIANPVGLLNNCPAQSIDGDAPWNLVLTAFPITSRSLRQDDAGFPVCSSWP